MRLKERSPMSYPPQSSEAAARLPPNSRRTGDVIIAIVAAVFALSAAQKFFIPLVFGVILACTLNPVVRLFERLRIPRLIGSTLVMIALLCGIAAATVSLRTQVDRILDQIPD